MEGQWSVLPAIFTCKLPADNIAAGGLLCFRDAVLKLWDLPRPNSCCGRLRKCDHVYGRQTAAEIFVEDFQMALLDTSRILTDGTGTEQDQVTQVMSLFDGTRTKEDREIAYF